MSRANFEGIKSDEGVTTYNLLDRGLQNTFGKRPLMVEKEEQIEKNKEADAHLHFDRIKSFKVDTFMIDRIVKNIQRRSDNHDDSPEKIRTMYGEGKVQPTTETLQFDSLEDVDFQRLTSESEFLAEPMMASR